MASKAAALIFRALEETGLPYEVKNTKGHRKILLAGRVVGVMGVHCSDKCLRPAMNVVRQIRQAAAAYREAA
jgi:hypothetical protein